MNIDDYKTKKAKRDKTYSQWRKLVNMDASSLKKFMATEEGKAAGLSKSEAKELGIKSGQESAEWILKMKRTPYINWTDEMHEWAARQVRFIKRMLGNEGDLYDEKGEKTRKHTSLLIWGHNPSRKMGGTASGESSDPEKESFVDSWKKLFNMSIAEMEQFQAWLDANPQYKPNVRVHINDLNASKKSKGGSSVLDLGIVINHQNVVRLRQSDPLQWSSADLKWAKDFQDLLEYYIATPAKLSKDTSVYRFKNLGVDLTRISGNKTKKDQITNESELPVSKTSYAKNIEENLLFMGTPRDEWRAVPVIGEEKIEVDGKTRKMPIFDFPKGYSKAPSMFKIEGSNLNCELCGKDGIKTLYYLQNDPKKWVLSVGSECVRHFEEGKSGQENLKDAKIRQAIELDQKMMIYKKAVKQHFRKVKNIGYGRSAEEWKTLQVTYLPIDISELVFNKKYPSVVNMKDVYSNLPVFNYEYEINNYQSNNSSKESVEKNLLTWFTRNESKAKKQIEVLETVFQYMDIQSPLKEQQMEEGGQIPSKENPFELLLSVIEPYSKQLVQSFIEWNEKNNVKTTKFDIEMYELQLQIDLIKAFGNYIKETDTISDIRLNTSSGTIVISCLVNRDGETHSFSSDVIIAGGYNVQRAHYRYIIKTDLKKLSTNPEYVKRNETLKRLTKAEKIIEDINHAKRRINLLNKEIAELSVMNDDQKIDYLHEKAGKDSVKYILDTTWEQAQKTFNEEFVSKGEQHFNEYKNEVRQRQVESFDTRLSWKYKEISDRQKMIEKELVKLKNLGVEYPEEFENGGEMKKQRELRSFDNEYSVKNTDFMQWLDEHKHGFNITQLPAGESKFIIRGYVGNEPRFIYNQITEVFSTNEYDLEALPKHTDIMKTGGSIKNVIRRNLPINKTYKIIDSYYTGGIESGASVCANCGKVITNVATIESEDGEKYDVGLDCAETLSGIGNTSGFNQIVADFNESKAIRSKVNTALKKNPEAIIEAEIFYFGDVYITVKSPKSTVVSVRVSQSFLDKYLPDYNKYLVNPSKKGFSPLVNESDFGHIDVNTRSEDGFTKYFDPITMNVGLYKVEIKHVVKSASTGRLNESFGVYVYVDDLLIGEESTYMKRDIPMYIARIINQAEFDKYENEPISNLQKGIKVEQEHRDTLEQIADGNLSVDEAIEQTAKDHIAEDPNYYDKLEQMEQNQTEEFDFNMHPTDYASLKQLVSKLKEMNRVNLVRDAMNNFMLNVVQSDPSKLHDYLLVQSDLKLTKKETMSFDVYLEDNAFFQAMEGHDIWSYIPDKFKEVKTARKLDFTPSPKSENLTKIVDDFVGTDDLRPVMMGTYFDKENKMIVATNAHIMLGISADPEVEKSSICLLGNAKKRYEKLSNFDKNTLYKTTQNDDGCLELEGKYPNYLAVIPREYKYVFTVSTSKLKSFIKGTLVVSNDITKSIAMTYKPEDSDFIQVIAYNGEFMMDVLESMEMLGHKEVDLCLTASASKAMVIVPTGNSRQVGFHTISTDFALIMPHTKYSEAVGVVPVFNLEENEVMSLQAAKTGKKGTGSYEAKKKEEHLLQTAEINAPNVFALVKKDGQNYQSSGWVIIDRTDEELDDTPHIQFVRKVDQYEYVLELLVGHEFSKTDGVRYAEIFWEIRFLVTGLGGMTGNVTQLIEYWEANKAVTSEKANELLAKVSNFKSNITETLDIDTYFKSVSAIFLETLKMYNDIANRIDEVLAAINNPASAETAEYVASVISGLEILLETMTGDERAEVENVIEGLKLLSQTDTFAEGGTIGSKQTNMLMNAQREIEQADEKEMEAQFGII